MRKLTRFIEELIKKMQFEIFCSETLLKMNNEINDYIETEYPNIKKDKYVFLIYDPTFNNFEVDIKPEFKSQLVKHYPEDMI